MRQSTRSTGKKEPGSLVEKRHPRRRNLAQNLRARKMTNRERRDVQILDSEVTVTSRTCMFFERKSGAEKTGSEHVCGERTNKNNTIGGVGKREQRSNPILFTCWHTRTFPGWFTFHLSGNSSYAPRIVTGMTGHPSCSCMCNAPWHSSNTIQRKVERRADRVCRAGCIQRCVTRDGCCSRVCKPNTSRTGTSGAPSDRPHRTTRARSKHNKNKQWECHLLPFAVPAWPLWTTPGEDPLRGDSTLGNTKEKLNLTDVSPVPKTSWFLHKELQELSGKRFFTPPPSPSRQNGTYQIVQTSPCFAYAHLLEGSKLTRLRPRPFRSHGNKHL